MRFDKVDGSICSMREMVSLRWTVAEAGQLWTFCLKELASSPEWRFAFYLVAEDDDSMRERMMEEGRPLEWTFFRIRFSQTCAENYDIVDIIVEFAYQSYRNQIDVSRNSLHFATYIRNI